MGSPQRIRDLVSIRPHPTVVRLEHLAAPEAGWITDSYFVTRDVRRHLTALKNAMGRSKGLGAFLIGQYGSGKSHFLAFLARQLQDGALVPDGPDVRAISLLNYSSDVRLEKILGEQLEIPVSDEDRRVAWRQLARRHPRGLVLLLDEVSEFLRSKPDSRSFNEDVRLLQFIGEWATEHRLWVVAALQEQIEHIGDLEHGLYRKIKDRYPLRFILSPAHVLDLIRESILIKKPGYDEAVAGLVSRLAEADPESSLDLSLLVQIYPLHPMTLELLEQVRDLFSQTRGVVDFTVIRLGGSEEQGAEPFLDRPWGELLTPEHIVDHFRDLFMLQPSFLPLAERLLPYYESRLDALFDKDSLRQLARRVIKLLVLVHLSPQHTSLSPKDTLRWLAFAPTRLAPARNLAIVERVLTTLADRGRYVVASGGRYKLDLEDNSAARLEQMLRQELGNGPQGGELLFEQVAARLPKGGFNPLALPRDAWQPRSVSWFFHKRAYSLYVGNEERPAPEGLGLCIRLPWGKPRPAPGCHTVMPEQLEPDDVLREAAALGRLLDQRHDRTIEQRAQALLDQRLAVLMTRIGGSFLEAEAVGPTGKIDRPPPSRRSTSVDEWLAFHAQRMLKRTFPSFERFAPACGPLPKEAYRSFMRFARQHDLSLAECDEFVKMIREGYLVPMALLRRRGNSYAVPAALERNELVRLVTSMLEHAPKPALLYENLAGPIYGLVPDQIHLLLVYLHVLGVLDLTKDERSYAELFETLPLPVSYDRVVPGGEALSLEQRGALEKLCGQLAIHTPQSWTVLAEKRAIGQLREVVGRVAEQLQGLILRLEQQPQGEALAGRLSGMLERWSSLERGSRDVESFKQFLYEAGSASKFIAEWGSVKDLPRRAERLLADLQRYHHLLEGARAVKLKDPEIVARLEAVERPPDLDRPEALERWLRDVAGLYGQYQQIYRRCHDGFWEKLKELRLWRVELPALAASRHLGLDTELRSLARKIEQAQARCCRGLVDLEFQPVCGCGFDGARAPLAQELDRLTERVDRLVESTERFFKQGKVRRRVAEWVDEGLETTQQTRDYLERRAPLPRISDLELLDRYLAGLELVAPVPAERVVELLVSRTWEPRELLGELRGMLDGLGATHIAFRQSDERGQRDELVTWCVEQSVRLGVPLPKGFSAGELAQVAAELRPTWVTPAALERLEHLGLGQAIEDQVLSLLLDGEIEPCARTQSALVIAASQAVRPREVEDPAQLAALAFAMYSAHPRLLELAGRRWLERLDSLARDLDPSHLPRLMDLIVEHEHLEAGWLVIDGLGLPLLEPLTANLGELFTGFRLASTMFARVAAPTTTDGLYRALAGAGIQHPLEKINCVDSILHARFEPLDVLSQLILAELQITCNAIRPRLDASSSLLIFGDHGFRVSKDGRGFQHGGDSALERVVPVFRLVRG